MKSNSHRYLSLLRSHYCLRNEESDAKLPSLDTSHIEYPEIIQYIIWSYKQKQHKKYLCKKKQ